MLGQNIGNDLRENQVAIHLQSLIAGVTDGLSGAKSRLTEAQLAACRERFSAEMRTKATGRMQQVADRNAEAGRRVSRPKCQAARRANHAQRIAV